MSDEKATRHGAQLPTAHKAKPVDTGLSAKGTKQNSEKRRRRDRKSCSTDEEEPPCESPVFGQPSPKLDSRVQRITRRNSLQSPSLFDDDERDELMGRKEGELNRSHDGLRVKRRNAKRRSFSRVTGLEEKTDGKPSEPAPIEIKRVPKQGNREKAVDGKEVLHEIQNTSEDVARPQNENVKVAPRLATLEMTGGKQRKKDKLLSDPDSPMVLRKDVTRGTLDDSDLRSPSMLTGRVHPRRSSENEEHNDKWLRRPEPKKPTLALELPKLNFDGSTDPTNNVERREAIKTKLIEKKAVVDMSPSILGKKFKQSKLSAFMTKRTIDLSAEADFNGGKLSDAVLGPKSLTRHEMEDLEMEEAIKRSLEDAGRKKVPMHKSDAAFCDDTEPQGYSVRAEDRDHMTDVDSVSELTGPAFTSTPFVENVAPKKKLARSESQDSQKPFKKPPVPVKTPKRKDELKTSSSARRSPRLNKLPHDKETRGVSSGSRRQLLSDEDATLGAPPGDLNGSLDPNVR